MVQIVHLAPGEQMPDLGASELWITIEADTDGHFYGTGCGRKSSGEEVFYVSLAENDATLEAAIAAATKWAAKRSVPRIWVQATPA